MSDPFHGHHEKLTVSSRVNQMYNYSSLRRNRTYSSKNSSGAGCGGSITTDEFNVWARWSFLDVSCRYAAGILLRKFIEERWSPIFKNFRGPAPQVEVGATSNLAVDAVKPSLKAATVSAASCHNIRLKFSNNAN